jgi:hypothetical protein
MIKILYSIFLVFSLQGIVAQKYFTKSGNISFYSDAPLEKIEAHNGNATAVMDLETGAIEWAVLIKGFEFEKSLMQEHFNENYMESSKFPKSIFKGKFKDWSPISISQNGIHETAVEGTLTIHGVSKKIDVPVTLEVKEGMIRGKSEFTIEVADFEIKIPGIVKDKIAKTVAVVVDAQLKPLNN